MSTMSSTDTTMSTASLTASITASITVNGEVRALTPDVRQLAALLGRFAPSCAPGSAPIGVAAAVNDRVVPRGAWATTALRAGDRVEIVTAVQGG